jgi:RNA polymerase sigma factor (TIGR02999 family)
MASITQLLRAGREGRPEALAALFDAMYPELKSIARRRLAKDDRGTLLDTTSLVNECFLKLAGGERLELEDRRHFLAYAATAMRSIVVDFARARVATRRGGGVARVTLDSVILDSVPAGEDQVLAVDEALEDLAGLDPRLAQIVEMRYFGGLSDGEIAEALDLGVRTVRRDWAKARLVLATSLRS